MFDENPLKTDPWDFLGATQLKVEGEMREKRVF